VAQTVASIFGDDPDRWAAMELATGLRVAEYTAGQRLHVARVLPSRLPHLNQALRAGRVSYGHVLLVVRATEPLSDQAARAVDATLAPRYGRATPGGLRNSARHAVVAIDPEGAAARHGEAVRRRAVSSRPEHDGMATLALYSTAADISLLEAAIADIAEHSATAAHTAGRLIPDQDALHADALIALARYWLNDTWPIPEPDPRHAPNPAAQSRTGTPPGGDPGGHLPGDPDGLPDTTWHHSRTDLHDLDDRTDQRRPGQRRPAKRGPGDPDPDHHKPDPPGPDDYAPDDYEPDEDPDGGGADRGRADPGGADPGGADPGGAHDGSRVRWGKRGLRRRGRDHTVVNIVIDLPTLLGLADNPARLDGYGTIPAPLARRLAAGRRLAADDHRPDHPRTLGPLTHHLPARGTARRLRPR
jgi:hypothetical protein